MAFSPPGNLSSTGYTFPNSDFFFWGTTSNTNYVASNSTGWQYLYNGTLGPDIAKTGYTDTIQGGQIPNIPATYSVTVGVNIGTSTVLDLGPALVASSGNVVLGYGAAAGIRVGVQGLADGTFSFSRNTGAIVSGKTKDSLVGESFQAGSAGIENYSCIVLGGGNDQVNGTGNANASYGLINWGVLSVGGPVKSGSKKAQSNGATDNDKITGTGALFGISNDLGAVPHSLPPTISTGVGDDVITGSANQGQLGINNSGRISMGSGDDVCQSTVAFGPAGVANLFGGGGTVVMGSGSDTVQGFGSGTFFGDGFRTVAQVVIGKPNADIDNLLMIEGYTYTVTPTTMVGRDNQNTINGFDITCAGLPGTMKVFGFEKIGTSLSDLTTLQVGTYNFGAVPT